MSRSGARAASGTAAAPPTGHRRPIRSPSSSACKFQGRHQRLHHRHPFLQGRGNTGPHVGNLWTTGGHAAGQRRRSRNETAIGLAAGRYSSTSGHVTAGTTYVASYHAPNGRYVERARANSRPRRQNAPLRALANTPAGANGVYRTARAAGFQPTPSTPPTTGSTSSSPRQRRRHDAAHGHEHAARGRRDGVERRASTSTRRSASRSTPATISPRRLRAARRGDQRRWSPPVTYAPATRTATSIRPPARELHHVYRHDQAAARRGHGSSPATRWRPLTGPSRPRRPVTCPCTILPETATPCSRQSTIRRRDTRIELGVKFRADADGFISGTAVLQGRGEHRRARRRPVDGNGTLLAQATFTGETRPAGRRCCSPRRSRSPANTTYVASYHTQCRPLLGQPRTSSPFPSFHRPPLHALSQRTRVRTASTSTGAQRVPDRGFNATNYWVDVVFNTPAPRTRLPPQSSSTLPARGDRRSPRGRR